MGSGKSTVARLLARQIGWRHVDLDQRITDRSGVSITDIFVRHGEQVFRELEHEELTRILGEAAGNRLPTVISLGGGTTTQIINVELLRDHNCVLIWLNCPIEELLARCVRMADRPLFRNEASFRDLYEVRRPHYELADYRVESGQEPSRVIESILSLGILERVPV